MPLKQHDHDPVTHVAKSAIRYNSVLYARGYILDRRHGHHKALFLKSWHKVVKNKEAELKVSPAQQEAARRRQRSWD